MPEIMEGEREYWRPYADEHQRLLQDIVKGVPRVRELRVRWGSGVGNATAPTIARATTMRKALTVMV